MKSVTRKIKIGIFVIHTRSPRRVKMLAAIFVGVVLIGALVSPTISEAVKGPKDLDTARMPLEYRLYRVLNAIEVFVDGSKSYKSYLAADIANEAMHLDVTDLYGVEWNLLQYNHDGNKPAGFGKANVGIGQIGPNEWDDSFVNQWLAERDWTGFDLLEDDVKNMLAVDAYIAEYVVPVLLREQAPQLYSKYSCISKPRYCDQLWQDYEVTTVVATYRNGTNLSPERHGYRIANWVKKGSTYVNRFSHSIHQPFVLNNSLLLIDEVNIGKSQVSQSFNDRIIRDPYNYRICVSYSLLNQQNLQTDGTQEVSSLVLRIGQLEYNVGDSEGALVYGPFMLSNQAEHCFTIDYFTDLRGAEKVSLEIVYAYDTDEMVPGLEVHVVDLGKLEEIEIVAPSVETTVASL